MPSGDFCLCDQIRLGHDWIWHDRQHVLSGIYLRFFQWIWSLLLPAGFFEVVINRYLLLIPSLAVFLLGAAAYMCAGLGSSPYDALPFIISGHVRRLPFKIVRMLWDISFMAAGFVLGGDVGIVTILVAFFLGPIITGVQKKLEVLIA